MTRRCVHDYCQRMRAAELAENGMVADAMEVHARAPEVRCRQPVKVTDRQRQILETLAEDAGNYIETDALYYGPYLRVMNADRFAPSEVFRRDVFERLLALELIKPDGRRHRYIITDIGRQAIQPRTKP